LSIEAAGNLYRTLQVDPSAEDIVIHAAYRALIKRHHPDAGGDPDIMLALNAAYATLGDPAARRTYDIRYGHFGAGAAAGVRHVPKLGLEFRRRFTPKWAPGGWLFDFVGTPAGSSRDHLWLKRCQRGDSAEAAAFASAVRAARLARPLLGWRFDVFVAVLGRCTECFESLLRAPRPPFRSLDYAVVAVDLAAGELRTVGQTGGLPAVAALADWLRSRR
jgi:DnaJ-like protein